MNIEHRNVIWCYISVGGICWCTKLWIYDVTNTCDFLSIQTTRIWIWKSLALRIFKPLKVVNLQGMSLIALWIRLLWFWIICKRLLAVFLSERFFSLRGIEFWAVDNIPKKQIVNSEKFDLMNVNILRGSCQVIYEKNILNGKVNNILMISYTGISHIHFTSK